jgi:gliding motility-associated-like protein
VLSSEIAEITTVDVVDFNESETNSLFVHVSGIGDYEYSLDQPDGPFQSSPYFAPVDMGIHTVYVNDRKNCGRAQKDVSVFGTPKYFTPNNDGFNDFWNLKGVSQTEGTKSIIYIFDRHGKLLKQISAKSDGWDGTYNGYEMPADDYWFMLQLEDGRTIKGHFALKR